MRIKHKKTSNTTQYFVLCIINFKPWRTFCLPMERASKQSCSRRQSERLMISSATVSSEWARIWQLSMVILASRSVREPFNVSETESIQLWLPLMWLPEALTSRMWTWSSSSSLQKTQRATSTDREELPELVNSARQSHSLRARIGHL